MGKIQIYMVCGNCHAQRFEKIDWPKKEQKKEEISPIRCNVPYFAGLDKEGNLIPGVGMERKVFCNDIGFKK